MLPGGHVLQFMPGKFVVIVSQQAYYWTIKARMNVGVLKRLLAGSPELNVCGLYYFY
jgi:hypothetical protein